MAENAARRSWFGRNWRWIVGIWLGTVLLVAPLAFVLFHNSDATKLALTTATSNPALIERLGQPIKAGWFVFGSLEVTSDFGRAELAIPVSGPKAKGTVYALAVKKAGLWRLTFLQFGADGESTRIELLDQ
jgi:hypothetical protein